MSRLHIQIGGASTNPIAVTRHPLSQAITQTLSESYCQPVRRAGSLPAAVLVSSLVTVAGVAQADVFEVYNLDDAGPGSLRQAVLDANANPGPDGIRFDDSLNGTITLTTGQMDINDSVVIQGPSEAALTIDPEDNSRIFDIQNTYTSGFTEINDMTLVNGYANSGGAIRAGNASEGANRVSLRNVTITDSYASDGNGGAIYANNVHLDVTDSTFSDNNAYNQGGAIDINNGSLNIAGSTFTNNAALEYNGGAVRADEMDSVIIDSSQFMDNSTDDAGGAIALSDIYVSALISNSTISNNTAGNGGGGVYTSSFAPGAALEINNTTVSGNTAGYGAGIDADTSLNILNNSMITGNTANNVGGGGIRFDSDSKADLLRIEDSNIDNNIAASGYGGGVHFYADNPSLLIRNSSISGNEAQEGGGGGIAVNYDDGAGEQYGFVTIQNSVVSNNTAASEGGGLFLEVDDVHRAILIEDSDFSGNTAGDDGGGLHFYFDDGLYTSLVIRNTTIADNLATEGGGMWLYDDDGYSVNIDNVTFSGNTAEQSGGGLWFYSDDGAPHIQNSTFSGNDAGQYGGGMFLTHEDGEGLLDNSTVTGNYAYYGGGGVYNADSELQIRSSIIAGNTSYNSNPDLGGDNLYVEFSLIGDSDGVSLDSNNNNLFDVDPLLGPLADNGGPTMTHALMTGSPAIDTGLNTAPSADDQRGVGFERMIGLQTDMGAVESDTDAALSFPPATQTVTNLDDSGPGSLRQAVNDSNVTYGLDVIEFQAGLSGTITLTSGDIDINDDVVINAPVPSVITVSGGNIGAPRGEPEISRIFRIYGDRGQPERGGLGDPSYNLLSVDIIGLTMTDGYTDENGGAIYANNAEVTIRDSVITNNQAYDGGGIAQYGGVLRVIDSTISFNQADGDETGDGGGIFMDAYGGNFGDPASTGNMVIRNSTIDNNTADYYGGGIHIEEGATLAIDNTTISNNSVSGSGGGGGIMIDILENSASISNSTITANTSNENGGGIRLDELQGYSDSLTLDNTIVSYNTALNEGGEGGGIFVGEEGSRLHIVNGSMIENNTADQDGGGIAFYADEDGAALSIVDSTISNNTSLYSDGGGVFMDADIASLNIINSTFSGNSAENYGGGLAVAGDRYEAINIIDSSFTANSVGEGIGGGIAMTLENVNAPIRIHNTQITNNTSNGSVGGLLLSTYYSGRGANATDGSAPDGATRGGNYGFYSSVTISDSTIAGNTADDDTGGMRFFDPEGNYALTVDNTTISGNTATNGNAGGIYAYSEDGTILIRNSTISGNMAGEGSGGGMRLTGADGVFIANSTIASNTASRYGGGIYANIQGGTRGGGTYGFTIGSSIVAGNTSGSGNANLANEGTNFDLLFSLLDDSAGAPINDNGFNVLDQDPLLGALASNGGPTQTHALMAGSPAINTGLNFAASVNDQRLTGFPRTVGTRTDMGAFEAVSNPALLTTLTGSPIDENGGIGTIDGMLSESAGISLFVDLSFGGVAILDTDFSVDSDMLFIPNDGTLVSQAPVTITGIDDNISEGDEPFTVDSVQVPSAGIRGGIPQLNGIIADDKGDPTVTLSLVGDPVAENGGTATITASLSNPSTQDVTVTLLYSGDAGMTDFTSPASIVIPMGMTSADITLTATDDALDEPDEIVVVDIDMVTNATEDGTQQVSATIIDDDAAPLVSLDVSAIMVTEGQTSDIIVSLDTPSGQDVTVQLGFSGTAIMPDDYTVDSDMITITAGQTTGIATITAIPDGINDPDETIIVDIINVTNGTEDGEQQSAVDVIDDGTGAIDEPVEVPTMTAFGKWLMALLLPLTALIGFRRRQTK